MVFSTWYPKHPEKQPFSWNGCFVETLKKTIFYIMIWSLPNETKHLYMGGSLNGGTPKTSQNDHF